MKLWQFVQRVYFWVDQYTNAALLCFALVMGAVMLLAYSTGHAAPGPSASSGIPEFPVIVNPNETGTHFIEGPAPGSRVFCRAEPENDGIHICQIWLMLSENMGVPASPEAYCYVVGEQEVIHNGVSQTRQNWSCGVERDMLSEERKARGPVNLRERPKSGELSI